MAGAGPAARAEGGVPEALRRAVLDLDPPFAVLDLDAVDENLDALAARAGGMPIRVASKSLRCLELVRRALAHPGFAGVLAFTLPEAIMLARAGVEDVVVAYPTAHRAALRELAADAGLLARVTLMVDSPAHLDLIDRALEGAHRAGELRLALDLDASYRPLEQATGGRVHIGARRSGIRTPSQARAAAQAIRRREGVRLVGVMAYEAQIAGVADGGSGVSGIATRAMQAASARELAARRRALVDAVSESGPLEFVNGGGTGSLERTAAEGVSTELAAGSGILSPGLFDGYRGFRHRPAAYFVCAVARTPAPGIATLLGGGWIASGPPGADRVPTIAWPEGARFTAMEGAGEVQSPITGPGVEALGPGDQVWLRHAKAGELAERVNAFEVVSGGARVASWPTYRGEGHAFL